MRNGKHRMIVSVKLFDDLPDHRCFSGSGWPPNISNIIGERGVYGIVLTLGILVFVLNIMIIKNSLRIVKASVCLNHMQSGWIDRRCVVLYAFYQPLY